METRIIDDWIYESREESGLVSTRNQEPLLKLMVGNKDSTGFTKVGDLMDVSKKACSAILKLLSEIENGLGLSPCTVMSKASITCVRFGASRNEELCFIGAFFLKSSWKPSDILAKLNEMTRYMLHQQIAGHVARGDFMLVAISYKNDHNLSVFHPSLLLCNSRSHPISNSSGYASMNACCIGWIRMLHNIVMHPRNLSSFRDDEHALALKENLGGGFSELPQEILIDIFAFLEFPDLVRVGSVCSSWNSAYTSMCSLEQYKRSQTPGLIYTSESAGEHVAFLYSLVEKRAYKLTLPELDIQRRYLIGSSHGWLVTADERSEMHLVNPVTSEQISLPSVVTIEQVTPILDEAGVICRYSFSRRTAKAIMGPSSTYSLSELRDRLFHKALLFYDTPSGSYFVVLIHNPFGQLSFARIGDEKWTWLPPHSHIDDCIYKDGLLYAVTLRGTVIAFDISADVVMAKIIFDSKLCYGNERVYIVEAPWGDLLQVRRPEIWISGSPHKRGCACCATFAETSWHITINKVCLASGKLIKMHSLDDHVLFLGHNQSLCSRAEEHPHVKPNHIYFTDDCKSVSSKCRRGYRLIIGMLNIQTMSMGEIVSPRLWPNCMAPLWIIPNPSKLKSDRGKDCPSTFLGAIALRFCPANIVCNVFKYKSGSARVEK